MKGKVFNIIYIITYSLIPIFLFLPVFYYKENKTTTKYNIFNIKDLNMAYFVIGIILLVSIIGVIVCSVISLIKKNNYSIYLKLSSGISIILFALYAMIYSMYLTIIMFLIVTLNMFIIAFDIKETKRKKPNMAIFAITYILFIFALIISAGLIPEP